MQEKEWEKDPAGYACQRLPTIGQASNTEKVRFSNACVLAIEGRRDLSFSPEALQVAMQIDFDTAEQISRSSRSEEHAKFRFVMAENDPNKRGREYCLMKAAFWLEESRQWRDEQDFRGKFKVTENMLQRAIAWQDYADKHFPMQ